MIKNVVLVLAVLVFALMLFNAVIMLPDFGSFEKRHVADYYLQNVATETGSANLVNGIVWDFRGYDTMGEEIVIFTAAMGVFLVIRRKKYGHHR